MKANLEIPFAIIVVILGAIVIYGLHKSQNTPAPKWMVMQCTLSTCSLEETEQLSAAGIHTPLLKKSDAYSKAILKEMDAHHSDEEQASVLAEMTLHYDQKRKHPMLNAEEVSKFKNLADSSEG